MAIQALRGRAPRKQRVSAMPAPSTLAIGDQDGDVFDCPSCGRPLVVGARRCPGCGTRLLLGVQARRATAFVSMGLIAGIAIGATGMLVFAVGQRAGPAPVAVVLPSARPSPPGPTSAPAPASVPASTPGVPAEAAATLGQTVTINGQVLAELPALRAELAAASLDTLAVATTLRTIGSDAMIGRDLAARLGGWTPGTSMAERLDAFYGELGTIAADGLASSLENGPAYRTAASAMITAIERVGAVDGATRSLAASVGTDLPPLLPGSSASP